MFATGCSARPCRYEGRAHLPLIDWRAMAGFRNVIVHNYLGINVARIWQIVAADLPPLRQAIDAMLAELDAQA